MTGRETAKDIRKKATIYDLSVLSGCSPSTVSAVLNGTWQKRRIKESTAAQIRALAEEHQYKANRQAQGLRSSRSGLIGLLLPVYDFRYFSSMAQAFEQTARSRGFCPIVVSSHRDPKEERKTAEQLISYSIDGLIICGATDPDGVHEVCERAGIPHVNADLPGSRAPSVITDNYAGGRTLTEAIIAEFAPGTLAPPDLVLIGGRDDHATRERVRAFREVTTERLGAADPAAIRPIGYSSNNARLAFEQHFAAEGRLPRAIFINSAINFEGLLRFISSHPQEDYSALVVGCYDYDPFASFLPFPVIMMRQDVKGIIGKSFELLTGEPQPPELHLVTPQLVPPRTALTGPIDEIEMSTGLLRPHGPGQRGKGERA